MQRHGYLWREFRPLYQCGCIQIRVRAMHCSNERIEAEIYGQLAPRRLFDRTEIRFGEIAERHARFRIDGQETFVVQRREIQTEATKIVAQKNSAAYFGVDRVAVRIGERQTKRKRRKLVEVRDESPAVRQQGLHFEPLLVAALGLQHTVRVWQPAVNYAEIGIEKRSAFRGTQASLNSLRRTPLAQILSAQRRIRPRHRRPIKGIAKHVAPR